MKHEYEELLACPVTKEKLVKKGSLYYSSIYHYGKTNGCWNFIPEELEELNSPLWKVWKTLQDNGVASYSNSPTNNLGVGPRKDFLDFASFCDFKGVVLDVGVGPQISPTHIEYNEKKNVHFIGIDPLIGVQPRKFDFVLGLGEYLPFKNASFDQVLFVTSLDHFIDPVKALQEAKRVLKNSGEICVWLGEKDKNAPKPKESPVWYKKLQIPEGAEDPFHFRRFTVAEFMGFIKTAHLKVSKEETHIVDPWRKNCFFKLIKA